MNSIIIKDASLVPSLVEVAPAIAFEGIDGSGKSFVIQEIANRIASKQYFPDGYPIVVEPGSILAAIETCTALPQPGSTSLGKKIREVFASTPQMSPASAACLMMSNRFSVIESIHATQRAGHWFLLDRHTLSTAVYQGYVPEKCPMDLPGVSDTDLTFIKDMIISGINGLTMAMDKVMTPAVTFILDLPVEQAIANIQKKDAQEMFDTAGVAFFTRARQGYLREASKKNHSRIIRVVDSSKPIPEVASECLVILNSIPAYTPPTRKA